MELVTRTMRDGKEMVLEDFTAHGFTVPAGFITDGASTPSFFWSIIPPFKRTKKAAVIHDYLTKKVRTPRQRKVVDRLFRRMLREEGAGPIRAFLGYFGVRVGAWFNKGSPQLAGKGTGRSRRKKRRK